MKKMNANLFFFFLVLLTSSCNYNGNRDQLPSWNEGIVKLNITDFVNRVTDSNSKDFIPIKDRIVVFDNDGTLWSEQPMPFQLFFAINRIKKLANSKKELKEKQPFKAVIENDQKTITNFHSNDVLKLVMYAHAVDDVEKFDSIVTNWLKTSKHPKLNKPYTELVYQPMLELLEYLRKHQFKLYIVSGGSVEFMRIWAPEVYGIPKEQIIGTTLRTQMKSVNGKPIIQRLPELLHNNDHEGKVISIDKIIGKKPIIAVGNSDGDLEMMQYTNSVEGSKLILYVKHTDEKREFFYDEDTRFGVLKKGITEAKKNNWTIIDMKKDWKIVYPTK
ncbi:HAD family hydrolase [Aquimarina sediminis]|uniref:HAD family hydrolase n=1 Tax=Aquimarina sediminis TaxID=2070536 RepID=UPI000CA074FD|nr:HAD family hydrolase [Aquimarina sediminis]